MKKFMKTCYKCGTDAKAAKGVKEDVNLGYVIFENIENDFNHFLALKIF